tara:strand:+ start:12377 stop:13015 length:639 start_codon:yes stop_codon:yes gene_type:complete
MNKSIKPMTSSDLECVAKLHQKAFRGFFLELMGKDFLKAYYRQILKFPESIAIVSSDKKGEINGFAVGFKNPDLFYKELKKNWFNFLLPLMKGLVKKPYLILNITFNFLRVSKYGRVSKKNSVELSSIAVGSFKKGLGSILLQKFIDNSWQMGANDIFLTTDKENNKKVIDFYESNFFKKTGLEKRNERTMLIYTLENPKNIEINELENSTF